MRLRIPALAVVLELVAFSASRQPTVVWSRRHSASRTPSTEPGRELHTKAAVSTSRCSSIGCRSSGWRPCPTSWSFDATVPSLLGASPTIRCAVPVGWRARCCFGRPIGSMTPRVRRPPERFVSWAYPRLFVRSEHPLPQNDLGQRTLLQGFLLPLSSQSR